MGRIPRRGLSILFVVLMLTGVLAPVAQGQDAAVHGVDVENMDLAVDPGNDFYTFVNGGWEEETEIPATEPSYGTFSQLRDQVTASLMEIVTGDIEGAPGSDRWRVGQLFAQATDVAARE